MLNISFSSLLLLRKEDFYATYLTDVFYAVFHGTFLVIFSAAYLAAYCHVNQAHQILDKLPGHNMRWILTTVMLLMQIAAMAEGLLTSNTRSFKNSKLVYLYVPSICAFITGLFSTVLSHYMEIWSKKWLIVPVAVYWIFSFGFEILRLVKLSNNGLGRFDLARFDICLLLIIIYGCLGILATWNVSVVGIF